MPVPYVPAINVCQAELRFTILGERCENVIYFEGVAGYGVAAMGDLAQALWDWWAAELRTHCHTQMALNEVYVTDLTTQTSPTVTYSAVPSLAGTNAIEPMPNSTALVVSFRTASRGRSARGRNYVAGATVSDVDSNTFTTAYTTAVLEAYALLNSGGYIPDWTQVVISRISGGNPRASALRQIVQEAVVVSRSVKTQRGRLPE